MRVDETVTSKLALLYQHPAMHVIVCSSPFHWLDADNHDNLGSHAEYTMQQMETGSLNHPLEENNQPIRNICFGLYVNENLLLLH